MNEIATEEYSHKPLPGIRPITVDDVYSSLSEGWADFKAAPQYGLFFGGIYALLGIIIFVELWVIDQPLWIVPLALAFPLVGPFVAIGLYEVSRRRELGEPLDWSEILGVVWRQRGGQMPFMAFIVLAGFMIWIWVARLIVALFLGRMDLPVYSDFSAMLTTGSGISMLVIGTVIGGVIAFLLYSITVMALPLLLDREIDFVSAMITSFKSVLTNLHPMLIWAGVIATTLFVAMIPFFLGLIIALPVLGHATWHLYRKVIVPENSASKPVGEN